MLRSWRPSMCSKVRLSYLTLHSAYWLRGRAAMISQPLKSFAGSSSLNVKICCYLFIHDFCWGGGGLLIEQNMQFENVTLGSGKQWWAFFPILFGHFIEIIICYLDNVHYKGTRTLLQQPWRSIRIHISTLWIAHCIVPFLMFGIHSTIKQPLCKVMSVGKQLFHSFTHSPVSRSEVLQRSGGCLQGVLVVTAGEKREVEPHHLWLVQQLQPFNGNAGKVRDNIQALAKWLHDQKWLKTCYYRLVIISVINN